MALQWSAQTVIGPIVVVPFSPSNASHKTGLTETRHLLIGAGMTTSSQTWSFRLPNTSNRRTAGVRKGKHKTE
jgi:hypothetical protein